MGLNGWMSYRGSILKAVFCFNFFLRGKSHVSVDGFLGKDMEYQLTAGWPSFYSQGAFRVLLLPAFLALTI